VIKMMVKITAVMTAVPVMIKILIIKIVIIMRRTDCRATDDDRDSNDDC